MTEEKGTGFNLPKETIEQAKKQAEQNEEKLPSIQWGEMKAGDSITCKVNMEEKKDVDFGDDETPDVRTTTPVELADGTLKSLWWTGTLKQKLVDLEIEHNDIIYIEFCGKTKSAKGRKYYTFKVSKVEE